MRTVMQRQTETNDHEMKGGDLRYEALGPVERSTAETVLSTSGIERVCDTILSLALHEEDAAWVEGRAVELLRHSSVDVQASAALALGHVARRHRRMDLSMVVPALEALQEETRDPYVTGRVEDAIDDIRTFVDPHS